MTPAPDLIALSGVCTMALAGLLNALAKARGLSKEDRAWVARVAPFLGSGCGYALGALLYGQSWQGALHGFIGGMCAVWAHQSRPRL